VSGSGHTSRQHQQQAHNCNASICPELKQVLEAATTLPRNSEICDAAQCTSKDKQVVWVCYDACGRWCHIDYANITEAPSGDFIRPRPTVSQLL